MQNYINQNNWLTDAQHECTYDESDVFSLVLFGAPDPNYDPNAPAMTNPVNALSSVLQKFPNASLGEHECTSTYNVESDDLTRLQLTCKLKSENESPQEGCDAVFQYLNQNNWLKDAETKCDGPDVKLEIFGK